jgi:hypothetical protein
VRVSERPLIELSDRERELTGHLAQCVVTYDSQVTQGPRVHGTPGAGAALDQLGALGDRPGGVRARTDGQEDAEGPGEQPEHQAWCQ